MRWKGGAAMQMDSVIAPVLQVNFPFMGCLVKANALVSGNEETDHHYHHS